MNLKQLPQRGNPAYFSFDGYLGMVRELVANNKTTGPDQSERLLGFTSLNLHRMERINKTVQVSPEIAEKLIHGPKQTWIVLSEAWCGDGAQSLPGIAKLAAVSNGRIDLKILLRHENIEWMEYYHTNGSHSIPKLIAFDEHGEEMFNWGPQPKGARAVWQNWKDHQDTMTKDEMEIALHTWYAKDKAQSLQGEIVALMQEEKMHA